jgi:hypothetical protein
MNFYDFHKTANFFNSLLINKFSSKHANSVKRNKRISVQFDQKLINYAASKKHFINFKLNSSSV